MRKLFGEDLSMALWRHRDKAVKMPLHLSQISGKLKKCGSGRGNDAWVSLLYK